MAAIIRSKQSIEAASSSASSPAKTMMPLGERASFTNAYFEDCVMTTTAGKNSKAWAINNSWLEWAVSKVAEKSEGLALMTSSVCVPIEPVEPKRPTRFIEGGLIPSASNWYEKSNSIW